MLQTAAIQPSSIPLEPPAAGMDVLAAIRGRRAVRSYTDEAVDRRTIEQLLDAAVEAPSAMGLEPWAFVVLEDRDRLARFSNEIKKELARGGEEPSQELADMLLDPSVNIFYGAPALVIVCATSSNRQAAEDCCLAAQTFMLAAHAEGLATFPIGLARLAQPSRGQAPSRHSRRVRSGLSDDPRPPRAATRLAWPPRSGGPVEVARAS